MRVLFTLGAHCEFEAVGGRIGTEWVSEKVFVQIEDYTDEEMRYAWNLAENATNLEVIDFEIMGDREYDERLVEMAAYVAVNGNLDDMRFLWPKTVYKTEAA